MWNTIKKWGLFVFWNTLMFGGLYVTEFMDWEGPMNVARMVVALSFLGNTFGMFAADSWDFDTGTKFIAHHTKFFTRITGFVTTVLIFALVYFGYWGCAIFLFFALVGNVYTASKAVEEAERRTDLIQQELGKPAE